MKITIIFLISQQASFRHEVAKGAERLKTLQVFNLRS